MTITYAIPVTVEVWATAAAQVAAYRAAMKADVDDPVAMHLLAGDAPTPSHLWWKVWVKDESGGPSDWDSAGHNGSRWRAAQTGWIWGGSNSHGPYQSRKVDTTKVDVFTHHSIVPLWRVVTPEEYARAGLDPSGRLLDPNK